MKIVVLVLVLVGLLCAVGPAGASDRSVNRAWDADDAKFERLGERVRTLGRRWRRSGYQKHARALVDALGDTRRTLDGTRARVRSEQASSETGERARYWALRSMRAFDTSLAFEQRFVRARTAGKMRRASRLAEDADEYLARASRFARRGKRLFRKALQ